MTIKNLDISRIIVESQIEQEYSESCTDLLWKLKGTSLASAQVRVWESKNWTKYLTTMFSKSEMTRWKCGFFLGINSPLIISILCIHIIAYPLHTHTDTPLFAWYSFSHTRLWLLKVFDIEHYPGQPSWGRSQMIMIIMSPMTTATVIMIVKSLLLSLLIMSQYFYYHCFSSSSYYYYYC